MATYNELETRINELKSRTGKGSISPRETFELMDELLAKTKSVDMTAQPLVVTKSYDTLALANADKNPINTATNKPMTAGQLMSVVADGANNAVYRLASLAADGTPTWEKQSELGDMTAYAKSGGSVRTLKELDNVVADSSLILMPDSMFSDSNSWLNAGYISAQSGSVMPSAEYVYSDFYKVIPFQTLRCRDFAGSANVRKVEFFDEKMSYISHVSKDIFDFDAVVPTSARLARFCCEKYTNSIPHNPMASVDIVKSIPSRVSELEAKTKINTVVSLNSSIIEKVGIIEKSFKSIYVNANPDKKYSLASVVNNEGCYIRVFNEDRVEVARYSDAPRKTGIHLINISEYGNSGVGGKAIIDFSAILGKELSGMFTDSVYLNPWVFDEANFDKIAEKVFNTNVVDFSPQIAAINDELLFNELDIVDNSIMNQNGYISSANGSVMPSTGYTYSDFLPVKPDTSFLTLNFYGSSNVRKVEFYNQHKQPVAAGRVVNDTSYPVYVVAPLSSQYVRFCAEKVLGTNKKPYAVFKDDWKRRASNLFATTKDFRLDNGAVVQLGKVRVVGNGNANKHLIYDVSNYLELITLVASFEVVNFDSNNNFSIRFGREDRIYTYSFLEIDKVNVSLKVWDRYNITSESTILTVPHGLTFEAGKRFVIKVDRKTNGVDVSISDVNKYFTRTFLNNDSIIENIWHYTMQAGTPFVSVKNGTFDICNIALSSDFAPDAKITVVGDSLVEGNTLAALNLGIENRWVSKLAQEIGVKKVAINAIGGLALDENSFSNFAYINGWFRSHYVIVELGVNNHKFGAAHYLELLQQFIAYLKFFNQIPVLVTVTPAPEAESGSTAYRDFRNTVNTWIRNSGELFIDANRAVTTDGHTWRDGMVLPDLTHFSVSGHEAVFQRMKIDVPELFL